MSHPAIKKAHREIISELIELVKAHNNEVEFGGTIITVEDPDIDTDFGNCDVGVEKLVYNAEEEVLYAHGAPYDEGARLDDAEPIDIEVLNVEELGLLLQTAQASVA